MRFHRTVGFNDGGYCGDPVGAAFGDSVDQECTNIDSSNNYRWGETSGDGPYYGSEGGVGWSVVLFSTEGCADDSTYVTQLQISNQCSGTPIEIDVADQQYWKSYSAKWVDYS